MLKKAAGGVLRFAQMLNVLRGYASPPRSLRPRRTTFLTILWNSSRCVRGEICITLHEC